MRLPNSNEIETDWIVPEPPRDAVWMRQRQDFAPRPPQSRLATPQWGPMGWSILFSLALFVALSSGCATRPPAQTVLIPKSPDLPARLIETCGTIAPVPPDPLTVEALMRWALEQVEGRACEQSRADALVKAWD